MLGYCFDTYVSKDFKRVKKYYEGHVPEKLSPQWTMMTMNLVVPRIRACIFQVLERNTVATTHVRLPALWLHQDR